MKVRILHDLPTTIDGKKIGPFRAGQEVELDDALAAVFIGSAMAEEVLPEPEPEQDDGTVNITIGDGTDLDLHPDIIEYRPLNDRTTRTRRKKAD